MSRIQEDRMQSGLQKYSILSKRSIGRQDIHRQQKCPIGTALPDGREPARVCAGQYEAGLGEHIVPTGLPDKIPDEDRSGSEENFEAFKVFNSRTRIVEENLHIRFSENTPNVVGSGPDWLFDINALTRTMDYEPIVAGTQSNNYPGTKACDNAGQARKETEPVKDYILLPLWTANLPFSQDPKSSHDDGFKPSSNDEKKVDEGPSKENECNDQEKEDNVNNTNNVNNVSSHINATGTNEDNELSFDLNMPSFPIPSIRIHKDHLLDQVIRDLHSATQTRQMSKNLEENRFKLDRGYAGRASTIQVTRVARIKAIRLFLAYASFKDFMVYQMDVKSAFLYREIEEEVCVCQALGFKDPNFPDRVYKVEKALCRLLQAPRAWYETLSTYLLDNGFQKGKIDKTLFIKRHKGDILLVQVYVDDIIYGSTRKKLLKQKNDDIFISQDKYVAEILKKFKFTEVKNASTPMETQKPLLKDEDGEEYVHVLDIKLIQRFHIFML
nr:hypothetical protein [Tanacetum cinerariifolium]